MKPKRSMVPCYSADGTSLGYRTLDAAQRLVAGGHVRPAYGRKSHLKAIWLLQEDGSSPVQSHALTGTHYSFIETLDNGRCWQLRRLGRRDTTTADGSPVSGRDPFLRVIRECMTASPDAVATATLVPSRAPTATPRAVHRTATAQ